MNALRDRYDGIRGELQTLVDDIKSRTAEGGAKMSAEERGTVTRLTDELNAAKEDWEAQRDLEAMADIPSLPDSGTDRELRQAETLAAEGAESLRAAAQDVGGRELVHSIDERAGAQLAEFAQTSAAGRGKISLNPHLAHNFAELQKLGVSPADYVSAVRSGRVMVAEETRQGNHDVRLYNVGTNTAGGHLVPTFWDQSLYLFASYIGGVQNAGATVIPVTGMQTMRLPKVTAYATAISGPATEGAAISTETNDTIGITTLTPRPYRGFAAETDELMRAAVIDTRFMLVIRALARALQGGKEADFHNGDGSSQPNGILNSIPSGRITDTANATSGIAYGTIPTALATLDAEYHADMRPGQLCTMMHSSRFFLDIVADVDDDGQPIWPRSLAMPGMREIFSTKVVFSHLMASTLAANNNLAVVGHFGDGYVIATGGVNEIEVSDDSRFLQWERVYRIQEYVDGQKRDENAFAWIQVGGS